MNVINNGYNTNNSASKLLESVLEDMNNIIKGKYIYILLGKYL